jgi:hypothetical protein
VKRLKDLEEENRRLKNMYRTGEPANIFGSLAQVRRTADAGWWSIKPNDPIRH